MIRWFRTRRPVCACRAALMVAASLLPGTAAAQRTPAMARVRSEDPMLAQLITDAPAASATFRDLVASIDGTNGIVYIESGHRHELRHAMEVLGEPGITTTEQMFFRLFGMSMGNTGRFESTEAVAAGIRIERELGAR